MKVLVTGSRGFIAKNLIAELKNQKGVVIFEFNRETNPTMLREFCREADFIFHLAGVNRPKDDTEFMEGNVGLTSLLLQELKKTENFCPVLMTSSIQAGQDNPYGISKKASEEVLHEYGEDTGANVVIYRLPNVFGKWCRPNYNSAIATFCYNIARDSAITVNNPATRMQLVYIDDVVREFIKQLDQRTVIESGYREVPVSYSKTLGEITELLYLFQKNREDKAIPDLSDAFTKSLYSTFISYLPEESFSYRLKMHSDARGSFTEFLRTPDRGQVSINVSKPGITKGNHWHHTKHEKFLVVSGKGAIRFRKLGTEEVIEYLVSGNEMEVVDIPPGYTHNIENLGDVDLVTVMWVNEPFDPQKPDTYFLEV